MSDLVTISGTPPDAPAGGRPGTDAGGLDFRMLGPLEVYHAGQPVPVTGARQRVVLATLLTAVGRVVSVDTLVEAVWGGDPPVTGRTQVAICVAALRKTLRAAGCVDEVLLTSAPGYRLALAGHRVDVDDFTARVARARALVQQQRSERAVEMFGSALALWRGPALADISSEVVRSAITRHEEERLGAYEQYTALRLEVGQHRALVAELAELVRQHPTWEQARAYLMLAYYRCGRRGEALEAYREGRERSISDLGLEPGPVLTDMHLAVLRDDPSLGRAGAPVATPAEVVPAQLPPDEPVFVGRDRELASMDEVLLQDLGRNRPLRWGQLTGGAGVGKTTLVVRWAHRVAPEFPDGQLFADLRGLDDRQDPLPPAGVLDDFIRALGRPLSQVPDSLDARVALYHSLLADRRMLIVLDNARSFAQVRPLLPGAGTCRVVVTCREPMPGPAAVRIRLQSLSPPEATALLRRAIGDDRGGDEPDAVARLVQLCEALPLALRSVAVKLAAKPHWTVQDLVSRLEDAERRLPELEHGGLGVAGRLELSYRTLPSPAAAMFRRLALLPTTEVPSGTAAALVGVDPTEAEDLLERLVDAHLVEAAGRDDRGCRRFRLAGLHRLYAWQCVRRDDPPAERERVGARVRAAGGGDPRCAA